MNPGTTRRLLAEMAEVLDWTDNELVQGVLERTALRRHLHEAADAAEQVDQRIAAADEALAAASRERAGLIAASLQQVQKFVDELIDAAKTQAEERLAAARAAADQITGDARRAAHEMLTEAREQAGQAVAAAERAAARRLAEVQLEADRMVTEARRQVAEIRKLGEEHLAGLIAQVEGFQPLQERMSQDLEVLARDHAALVKTMADLRAKIQAEVLPLRQQLLHGLGTQDTAAPGPETTSREPEAAAGYPEAPGAVPQEAAIAPPQPAPAEQRDTAPGDRQVEIVLQDVDQDLAREFVAALSRLAGVKLVLLQNYYHTARVATIDLIADRPFNGLDLSPLDEYRIAVLADAGDMLTLHLDKMQVHPVSA